MRHAIVALLPGLLAGCDKLVDLPDEEVDAPVHVDTDEAYRPETGAPTDSDALARDDEDGDGVDDLHDNCGVVANPDQADQDGDATGDLCDDERDGDGIPDARDLFADDPALPGVSSYDHVYAHGPSELWRLDVPTRALERLASFSFDQYGGQVTDIAIDRYGVLYAVTFYDAFVCHPDTARCWWIGHLSTWYNGLTFVPDDAGVEDVLVGIAGNGTWTAYEGVPFALVPRTWGGYGAGRTSSGDAYHLRGVGTWAAVNQAAPYAHVVEVDTHGRVLVDIVELTGHSGIYGLAGAMGVIFAFSANGAVLEINPAKGGFHEIARGPGWWGAGVRTIVVP